MAVAEWHTCLILESECVQTDRGPGAGAGGGGAGLLEVSDYGGHAVDGGRPGALLASLRGSAADVRVEPSARPVRLRGVSEHAPVGRCEAEGVRTRGLLGRDLVDPKSSLRPARRFLQKRLITFCLIVFVCLES